ncbi:MAG: ATP-binding cassette domain-containing protein [Ruminiclostridium sp.]|nr:ATP-binding cassette domain-containing protein [Ruminiclostridium sp.]
MDYILSTNNLTKRYGKQNALDNVSVHIKKGDIYGLIGKNGAGKTTLLRIISGLADATSGEYSIFGKNPQEMKGLQSRIGVLVENPGIYPDMTAYQNVRTKCLALGIRDKNVPNELLKLVNLSYKGKKPAEKFSLGMRQRLGMAMALAGNPDIFILYEPINGLDPEGIIEVREMITKLNHELGITFIISSHILEELAKTATVFGIINNGAMVEEISSEKLAEKCESRIELMTDDASKACTVLEEMGFTNYKVLENGFINIYEQLERTGDITMELALKGVRTTHISIANKSLEEYYVELVGGNGGNKNA